MFMIGEIKNFDNNFFRMVNASLCKTLTRTISWVNYFTDKKIRVVVPFYMSMTGSERYLFDAFVDDIPDKRIELNTDQIPRGVITLTSFAPTSDEFANPNQYLAKKSVINGEMRKVISRVKAVPITFNYDIEIRVDSEIDAYKCSEKILNMLFNYMFFNIDYKGIKIDAVLHLPDDKEVTIPRELGLDTDSKKIVKFSLQVKSYFPLFYAEQNDKTSPYLYPQANGVQSGVDCFSGRQPVDDDFLEVCSNDSDFDWDRMEMTRPSEIYECLIKNGLDYNKVKRVYWTDSINRDEDLYGTTGTTMSNI